MRPTIKQQRDITLLPIGGLARLERQISPEQAQTIRELAGGKSLAQLAGSLLDACNPDVIAERATGKPNASPAEVTKEIYEKARVDLVNTACAPFDLPELRDTLARVKQDAEQIIDTVTVDTVIEEGYSAAAREKAQGLVGSFRDYIEQNKAEIEALQILYSRPYSQRLTETMLKELEEKLRSTDATWNEDTLWRAFAATVPERVKGRSAVNRFADLVPLVRFALEQQPVLEPFAESVQVRFQTWLESKRRDAASTFSPEQIAWLELIRDHIATSLSIEPEDFDYAPFSQRGGLGKAYQLFGDDLSILIDELNQLLAA